MKRSAAILGPTPAFLSWTIVATCPFRDPEAKKPINAAFQELRSLRAVAVGEVQRRVVDGFCLHPDSADFKNSDATGVSGFPVDEVYAAFGGRENAAATCRVCPANVPVCSSELDHKVILSKGGCFGWLPFGPSVDNANQFLKLLEVETNDQHDQRCVMKAFEDAVQSIDSPLPFPKTSPGWFGVWNCQSFSKEQLGFLDRVCSTVKHESIAWKRLAFAIKQAYANNLKFICSLLPRGDSDGTHWIIESQCPACGDSRSASPCDTCCDDSAPLRSRRMRVLGLRPYLNLASVVGEEAAKKLVEKHQQTRGLGETE